MKKNASGSGSLRKIQRGPYQYWEGRLTVGTDPATGKPRRRSFTGKSQSEVREKMTAAAASLAAGTYVEPSKQTVAQWLDDWLQNFSADKKASTVALYAKQIRIHVKPSLGAIPLSKLSRRDVQKFINGLQLAPATVQLIHGLLSGAMKTAVDLELIQKNPCTGCALPRIEKKEVQPLAPEEIKKILACDDALFPFLLLTGLRISEALGLTWDCVNGDSIRIEKQYHNGTFTTPKNGKPRTISPAPAVFDLLRARKAEQIQQRFRAGELWEGPKDFQQTTVFATELGKPLHYATVQQRFKKLCPDAHLHTLRHTYALLSLQNGDDIKSLQQTLGHATAVFCLNNYCHVSDEMRKASAARMQKYIDSVIS